MLLGPLGLTAILSFNVYDPNTGPVADQFTLAHYLHVLTDSYFLGIFWRTFWIAALVSLICVLLIRPHEVSSGGIFDPRVLEVAHHPLG